MASQLTTHLGFNKFGPSGAIADDGYKFALKDRELFDALLWTLLNHDHRQAFSTALAGPVASTPPELVVVTAGGTLPAGRSYFYKFSFLDSDGNETESSTAGFINTEPALRTPASQNLTLATTGGSLGNGTFRYAMSFYQSSGGETTAPNVSTMTIGSGTGTNTVTIPLETLPDGADGWKIYRKAPGDLQYGLLATVASGPTTYVDDGSVNPDCNKKRPVSNTTNSVNKITITIPTSELPLDPRIVSWRIYRTQTAGSYGFNSLVSTVSETQTEGGTDLVTSFDDVGGSLSSGIPLSQSATPPPIPQLDAADIFNSSSSPLPSSLAPLGVHQFYTFMPGTLAVQTYNQVFIPNDIKVERIDGYYSGLDPTGLVQGVAAQGTLTLDVNPTDGNTMTVDAKVYTFETSLTDVDGNIFIAGTLAETQTNLVAAFDLSGVAGTDYAASMTAHASVNIADFAADAAVLTAKTKGTAGNSIVTTETFTAGTNIFDAATLGTTTSGVNEVSVIVRFSDDSLVDEVQSLYNDAILQNEFQKISNGATSGTFTLSFDGQGPTGVIAFDATAATLKTELELLSNITSVSITGSGTSLDPWIVEFLDPGSQDVAQITSDDTLLVGGTTTITTTITGSDGGTFTLSDGTDTTAALAYNVAAATIKTRLEADLASITTVSVAGTGILSDPWLITFTNPGDQDLDMLVVSDASLNGVSTIAEVTKGRGNQQVDLVIDQDQAYHFFQTPTNDEAEQQAESAPATGGTPVSDTLATNDAASELATQTDKNSWVIGTLGKGTYTFSFWLAGPDAAQATMRVLNDGAVIGTLIKSPNRNTYDDPVYTIELTLDGSENISVEVEKTDAGADVVRVDKYKYLLQLPTLFGGQMMTVEVLLAGVPTTNGDDLQVNLWY